MRICCIIGTKSPSQGAVYDTNQQFFSQLCTRSTQIGFGELMGVLVHPATLIVMTDIYGIRVIAHPKLHVDFLAPFCNITQFGGIGEESSSIESIVIFMQGTSSLPKCVAH